MIPWYHILWIIALALFVGGQLTSWYERKFKYNLNDLEKDALRRARIEAQGYLGTALDKLKGLL